jgi:hypothetical protein
VTWKYINTCKLNSERVIDATVYKIKDTWYMVYKDEAAGSHTYRSQSKDMIEWTNPVLTDRDGGANLRTGPVQRQGSGPQSGDENRSHTARLSRDDARIFAVSGSSAAFPEPVENLPTDDRQHLFSQ